MERVLRVAIYCRLSEEDRDKKKDTDDSDSIQNQKSILIKYALDQGWEVYKIYSDDDYTGADRNRPDWNELLKDAESRKFDIVLCKTQARFTRELELVEKYIHGLFPIWGIRFVSVVDNADTANKGNKKSRQINGLVNEWYLEDLSENIKSVLEDRRKEGYHIGSFALYGYKKDPDQEGHLIIDEEAAEVVREVFALFSQGYGKTKIARMLNERGIPNPTEYKRQKGLRYKQAISRNSTLWKYYSISDMLVNEMYIGNMVQGKYGSVSYKTKKNKPRPKELWYRVEGTHEAIIDSDLWDRVQELIKQKTKPFKIGKIGIFAKKAKCMHCGYTLRSVKNHGYYYLQCQNKYVSEDSCIGSFIPVKKLEKLVLDELHKLINEYLDKDEVERKIELNNNFNNQKVKLEKSITLFEKKIEEYSSGIQNLYLDKVKGIITEKQFVEFSRNFTDEKEKYEGFVTEHIKQISDINEKMHTGDNRLQIVEQYMNIEKLDRETVEKLIDYILIGKRDEQTKEVPIEIHWNF
ncbi:recombinase family protein [Sedimentibacter sp. LTW-03]|uniref:recombinase family protein n=1 Tax=Sedimentibacter sp. LTW-03 TaxID=3453406 RepID=UPI003F829E0B